MNGMLKRPTGFDDPRRRSPSRARWARSAALIVAGAVLVLGGGAYGPIAKRTPGAAAGPGRSPPGAR